MFTAFCSSECQRATSNIVSCCYNCLLAASSSLLKYVPGRRDFSVNGKAFVAVGTVVDGVTLRGVVECGITMRSVLLDGVI